MPISNSYVISLDAESERMRGFNDNFKDLNVTHYQAIRTSSLTEEQEELKRRYIRQGSEMSRGEIGCFLSHISLWKKLLDSNEQSMMIFEDDARSLHSVDVLNDYVDSVTESYDILYLGKCLCDCLSLRRITDSLYEVKHILCTHAYIITRSGAQKMLSSSATCSAVDQWINKVKKKIPDLKLVAFHPSLIYQDVINTESSLRNRSVLFNTCECRPPVVELIGEAQSYPFGILLIMLFITIIVIALFWAISTFLNNPGKGIPYIH